MNKIIPIFILFLLVYIFRYSDLNNILTVGISALFLIVNAIGFTLFGRNTYVIFRNIFGLLAIELITYGAGFSIFLHSSFAAQHPLIDAIGITTSIMFFVGVSIFLFMLFLLVNWAKEGII